MEQENKNTQEPVVPDVEMKMPEGTSIESDSGAGTKQLGIILGVLIVLLALILGGLYLWGSSINIEIPEPAPEVAQPAPAENNEPESTIDETQIQALDTVSTSDEISAIEADIENTDLDELDAELDAIDAEFQEAPQSN
jgi:flagellar basal body-associated protein FliL